MGDGIDVLSARQNAGLNIGQLAKMVGVSEAKLSHFETDPSSIPARLAKDIAAALELDIDDINFSSSPNTETFNGVRLVSMNKIS